jgi:DNA-binding GntR family transcriptional regulator
VKALKARKGETAERLMREHILGANDAYMHTRGVRESN